MGVFDPLNFFLHPCTNVGDVNRTLANSVDEFRDSPQNTAK
jgi:hypothetical protein